ncbi:MAG: L-serine ammonia-lyase, iron-sulfur-dependent, subunit alpha [Spirochaetaceae bacterium]|nr:L-serine ammonia-lyase, iron-sulfur-dependent, subunit alpha [Spirochaetaceae bacterium]
MAGCALLVVINSGSGNQGITITVPIYTMGKFLNKSDSEISKALCIGELIGLSLNCQERLFVCLVWCFYCLYSNLLWSCLFDGWQLRSYE